MYSPNKFAFENWSLSVPFSTPLLCALLFGLYSLSQRLKQLCQEISKSAWSVKFCWLPVPLLYQLQVTNPFPRGVQIIMCSNNAFLEKTKNTSVDLLLEELVTVHVKISWSYSPGEPSILPQTVWHFESYTVFSGDDDVCRRACWGRWLEKRLSHFILTVLSFTRWWGQLKRNVPNREIRVLSYSMVKYTSENSKAAGYCSSSCQTQSRNIKNKGDWEKKERIIRFNLSFSHIIPVSAQSVLHWCA